MILFASMTYTFTVQAADMCASHDSVTMQGGDDCHSGSDPASADQCPDCLHHCYGSFSILGTKSASLPAQERGEAYVITDYSMSGGVPSSLLRPPQSV